MLSLTATFVAPPPSLSRVPSIPTPASSLVLSRHGPSHLSPSHLGCGHGLPPVKNRSEPCDHGLPAVKKNRGPSLPLPLPSSSAMYVAAAGSFLAATLVIDAHPAMAEDVVRELLASETKNALSLPTWTIHVASVVEWVVAMALVWKYGDTPGNAAWKGLSWGMVPLLGGAMCACTWHFFYNAESLEILVALQAALTMIGNFTMWLAAFRIYKSTQNSSKVS